MDSSTMRKLLTLAVVLFSLVAQSLAQTWQDPSSHIQGVVQAGNIRLSYLDWGGNGLPIIFLAGLGQSPHIFDHLAVQFTNKHHVIGMFRRGHGTSDRPSSGYDSGTLAEDLRAALDALSMRRVVLVGYSFGGVEVTEFLRRYSDRVERVVYLDSAYDNTKMPTSGDPVRMPSPTAEDLANIQAGMKWFERAFGFATPAIEADARAMNMLPGGKMTMEAFPLEIGAQLWKTWTSFKPDFSGTRTPVLAIYAISESHPILSQGASADLREKADEFWRNNWVPYQEQSLGELLATKGPVRIAVLRNTSHLCFFRPQDEAQVVHAISTFLDESF
jgi:non-heme chloroperoxidase